MRVVDRDGAATVTPHMAARIEAASLLRRLGHAFVAHEADEATHRRLAAAIAEVLPAIEGGDRRSRPVDDMKRRMFETPPDDGETMDHFPDCVVSGAANPMGVAITVRRDGQDAVARVALGPAFEGAPGRAHGGIVAAVFDDTMGFVLTMERTAAYTGRLSVSYLAPTPIGEEIEFRCRLRERAGRKLTIDGEAVSAAGRFATAEGLFIAIPLERFGEMA